MRRAYSAMTLIAALSSFVSAGCGSSRQALVSVTVSPASAIAAHGSANDTVRFTAMGNYATYNRGYQGPNATAVCLIRIPDSSRPLSEVTWSTSDSVNTSVDASGLATCLGTTAEPATITALAAGVCGGEKATATLTCN